MMRRLYSRWRRRLPQRHGEGERSTSASFRNILRPAHACVAREARFPSPLSLASSAAEGSPPTRRECELQLRGRALMSLSRCQHAWRREGEVPVSPALSAWRLRRRILAPGLRRGRRRGPCAFHLVPLGVGCQKVGYWMMARRLLVGFWVLVCRQEDLALHECERAPPPILSCGVRISCMRWIRLPRHSRSVITDLLPLLPLRILEAPRLPRRGLQSTLVLGWCTFCRSFASRYLRPPPFCGSRRALLHLAALSPVQSIFKRFISSCAG